VYRISLRNATILSSAYLLVGAATELARRSFSWRWAERTALSLELFPARLLDFAGIYEPLREAWMRGQVTNLEMRFIYGATTVLVIYLLGLGVGAGMWGAARMVQRREPPT
jgi:hypothetical protein